VETKDLAKVRGRSPSRRWPSGYWWLAYDWSNYLLSCEVCNRVWKGNLFPIRQPPHRSAPPAENSVKEVPLLLSPYGSRDPARHLQFNKDGSVEPRKNSTFGRETPARPICLARGHVRSRQPSRGIAARTVRYVTSRPPGQPIVKSAIADVVIEKLAITVRNLQRLRPAHSGIT
jgi:hypothetical protein